MVGEGKPPTSGTSPVAQVRPKGAQSVLSLAPSGKFRPEHHNHQWPTTAPQQSVMNFCCKLYSGIYSPTVRRIPISKDEDFCMREAPYPSAATPTARAPQNLPGQLDPGSLYDPSRRRVSKNGAGSANSLLKQAIANRLKPNVVEKENPAQSDTSPPEAAKIRRTDSEMAKSLLLNPAWYRDSLGRTGYKSKEWEKALNAQKDVVKDNKKAAGSPTSEDSEIKRIDSDLLLNVKKDGKQKSKKTGEENQSFEEKKTTPVLERKLSKEEKKEAKNREKEEKKKEKAEKKAKKELEKLERKLREAKAKHGDKAEDSGSTSESGHAEIKKQQVERSTAEATIKVDSSKEGRNKKERKSEKTGKVPRSDRETAESQDSNESSDSSQPSRITITEKRENDETSRNYRERNPKNRQATREPHSTNIGDRRDSSFSEASRISGNSHKSVKFSDKVQMREFETRNRGSSEDEDDDFEAEDDDVAIMSDDEMSKPDSERRRRLVKLLQMQQEDERHMTPLSQDIYDEDLEDFEEQERLALLAMQQGYHPNLYDDDSSSQRSYYAEDVEDRFYVNEDGSSIPLDNLPYSVRQAIIADLKGRRGIDEPLMGSMSRLHGGGDSSDGSLVSYPHLPRSASGYFEPNMNYSYQAALYKQNPASYSNQEEQPSQAPQKFLTKIAQANSGTMHASYYENDMSGTPNFVGSDRNFAAGSSTSQLTPIPSSSQNETPMTRKQFFASMDQTSPSTSRPPFESTKPTKSQKNVSNSSSQSDLSHSHDAEGIAEKEMQKKFVARFGPGRKAPIAREEDPADPEHMGSRESVLSSDSRESHAVISTINSCLFFICTSDPIGKPLYERYNFSDMDRNLAALAKPLWAGTEKEDAEHDESNSS
ncbi:unnamed protein product [Caenorhabditis auriculariae]|uniref:Uncharacterized protein n=1 Tax=Caenorhabditis auriculariae TaxID=2777116 RepID=A0A8S1GV33_9PELO|nr:unnamed protein product [Caenorhabditis auriculariae]